MRRSSTKKGIERRKRSRDKASASKASVSRDVAHGPDSCHHCGKGLSGENDRALFVEEEVGRIFCSEDCITAYFAPEIERLEKEYLRRLAPDDLSNRDKESLAHLRWITLQEPDEVWKEKTLKGDHRYTLISEFKPNDKTLWSICICLFLRGEPSFLFLAFTTRNREMMEHYRRGQQLDWEREKLEAQQRAERKAHEQSESGDVEEEVDPRLDRLADSWTEDETLRAQMLQARAPDDIPVRDFSRYESCLEQTLEEPEEVWSLSSTTTPTDAQDAQDADDEEVSLAPKVYHFIRHYTHEARGNFWYVVIARETDAESPQEQQGEEHEQMMEIQDAFPTRDPHLVERFRRGRQEVGAPQTPRPLARVVH